MTASADAAENKNRELFEKMPVYQALIRMCVPTIIGQMVVLVYNMADTFFIGRTANPYMIAATSLVLPIFNMSNTLSDFVGVGSGALISRLLGQYRDQDARRMSAFAVYFGLLISLAWSAFVFCLMTPLLHLLGASSRTFEYTRQYMMLVVVLGGIPTIVQLVLAQLLRATGYSRQAGFGISMGGILNMVLDPLFMFVILPDGMEVIGAGIATALSNVCSLIYFIIVITRLRSQTVLTFSPKAGLPSGALVREAIAGGIPSAMSNGLFNLSQLMINKLMAGYGDIALAAVGIVLKAERIPLNTGVGITQGMMPLVAYNYSNGNYKRMKQTIRQSRLAGLAVAAAAIVVYEFTAPAILRLFINNAETDLLGAAFLRVRCLATPFMFLCFHMLFAFQGMGENRTGFWLAVIRQLVLYVPLLLLMNVLFGMYGLVWTQVVSDGIMSGITFLFWHRFEKKILNGK